MVSLVSSVGCVGVGWYLMVLVCLPLSRISMRQQSSQSTIPTSEQTQHDAWLGKKAHSYRKLASPSYSTAVGIAMFCLDAERR